MVLHAKFQHCGSNLVSVENIQFPLLRRIRDQTRLPFIFIDLIVFLLKNFSFQIVLPEREEHQPEPDCPGARGGQRRRPELRRQLQDLQGQSSPSYPPLTKFEEKFGHCQWCSQAVLNCRWSVAELTSVAYAPEGVTIFFLLDWSRIETQVPIVTLHWSRWLI